jgi:hypothetical protein
MASIFSVEMKLEAVRSSETSIYKTTGSHNKDYNPSFHCSENVKSHTPYLLWTFAYMYKQA